MINTNRFANNILTYYFIQLVLLHNYFPQRDFPRMLTTQIQFSHSVVFMIFKKCENKYDIALN